jgi:predicted transcriptional regulator
MKTAISIPDHVFHKAERLAKASKVSRSALYTKAIEQLLSHTPSHALTEAYSAAFGDMEDDNEDATFVNAARDLACR